MNSLLICVIFVCVTVARAASL